MKVLTSEQQTELQKLIENLSDPTFQMDNENHAQLVYWSIELKPKRVRKNNKVFNEIVSGLEDAIKIGNGVDNPVE